MNKTHSRLIHLGLLLLILQQRGLSALATEDKLAKPAALESIWDEAARAVAVSNDESAIYQYTRQLLSASANSSPDEGASVRSILQSSQNFIVKRCAEGAEARAALKQKPISMTFVAIDGREVDLEKMRGHPVLIDFRGILHCEACVAAEPMLKEIYRKYHKLGFQIISVANDSLGTFYEGRNALGKPKPTFDQLKAKELEFCEKHGLEWPTYSDGKSYSPFRRYNGANDANPFFQKYDIAGTPTYFLIDKSGRLEREVNNSFILLPGCLESWVKNNCQADGEP